MMINFAVMSRYEQVPCRAIKFLVSDYATAPSIIIVFFLVARLRILLGVVGRLGF